MARESFRPSPGDRTKIQVVETDDSPVLVDLDGKDAPIIQVLDDRTDDEKTGTTRDPAKWDEQNAQDPKGVSPRTQKRFDRLKAETETERRLRLQTERERDEAVRVAAASRAEVDDLRQRLATNTTSLATSMTAERDVRIADATRRLEQAHAEGNSSEIAKATADLTTAAAERVAIAANTPRAQPAREEQPRQQQQPQQTQAPQLAPNVAGWIAANPWFNKDKAKTEFAVSVHRALEARGVRPESDEYTRELDKGMKAVYADHQPYSGSQPDDGDDEERTTAPRRTNAVAPGSRDTRPSGGPRTVELTATEYAVARQLGLTSPKQLALYAAEKQKRDQNGKGA